MPWILRENLQRFQDFGQAARPNVNVPPIIHNSGRYQIPVRVIACRLQLYFAQHGYPVRVDFLPLVILKQKPGIA
jgi:hypothetical protein